MSTDLQNARHLAYANNDQERHQIANEMEARIATIHTAIDGGSSQRMEDEKDKKGHTASVKPRATFVGRISSRSRSPPHEELPRVSKDELHEFTEALQEEEEARELPKEDQKQVFVLTGRAQKKWDQLDVDESGFLVGEEIEALAEWVWCSFRPGLTITPKERKHEAKKIMVRCDENNDGSIDEEEFLTYYERTAAAMTKFHKAQAQKKKKTSPISKPRSVSPVPSAPEADITAMTGVGEVSVNELPKEDQKQVFVLTGRAQKKWDQLDVDESGFLVGEEIEALAEWVWCSFRPGLTITPKERKHEAKKIMVRCDENNDGSIDEEEFLTYYERTAAAMTKFHKAQAQKKKLDKKLGKAKKAMKQSSRSPS